MNTKNYKIAMLLDNPFGPDMRVLREAQSLVEAGNEVTIFAWDRDSKFTRPSKETLDQINIVRIVAKSERQMGIRQIPHYLSFAYQAFRLVLKQDFDVIHCHDLPDLPIGVLLKRIKHVNLVYDAHEIYWLMEAKKYPKFLLSIIRYGEGILLREVDVLITVGKKRADYYKKIFQKTIYIVGNWYNPMSQLPQDRDQFREMLGISTEDYILTYAGTLSRSRSIDLLIRIAEEFAKHHPNIHLVVAGTGPEQSIFENSANINKNLHYLGWLENTSPLYSASDALIYLMDSTHPYANYNSPNNLYLSIAWGLPFIGSKSGEIASVLDQISPSLLVEQTNVNEIVTKVVRLSQDREHQMNIRLIYKSLQAKYNWDLAKNNLLSAYNNLPL